MGDTTDRAINCLGRFDDALRYLEIAEYVAVPNRLAVEANDTMAVDSELPVKRRTDAR